MSVPRPKAKTINLGLAYGMQGASLAKQLGLPTEWVHSRRLGRPVEVAGPEAKALLDKHKEAVPFISELFEVAKEAAETRGYVKTIIGRKIRFERYGGEYWRTHKALNGIIQGSAADQMKTALVTMRREGLLPTVTVHDEADASIPRGAEGDRRLDRMVQIMEQAIPLAVPVLAEVSTGPNWGECS